MMTTNHQQARFERTRSDIRTMSELGVISFAKLHRDVMNAWDKIFTPEEKELITIRFGSSVQLTKALFGESEPAMTRQAAAQALAIDEHSILHDENTIMRIIVFQKRPELSVVTNEVRDYVEFGNVTPEQVQGAVRNVIENYADPKTQSVAALRFGLQGESPAGPLTRVLLDKTEPLKTRVETAQELGTSVQLVLEHEDRLVGLLRLEFDRIGFYHHPDDIPLLTDNMRRG